MTSVDQKQPAAAPGSLTLRAEARLVIVDVTVLDKKGVPVSGLKLQDFQLREDNTPQKITSVEAHGFADGVSEVAGPLSHPPELSTDSPIVVSNRPSVSTPVWNVVLVDLYNTPAERRGALQAQLEDFLKHLPETQPIALVTMSGRIKVNTSFEEGAGAAYRYLRKNGLAAFDASTPANIVERQEAVQSISNEAATLANKADVDVDRQAERGKNTLACFSALAQWLMPYPGKKNVYWLTAGFPFAGPAIQLCEL